MPTLNWIGKSAVVGLHHRVAARELTCDPRLSAPARATESLVVEGDNLEALKSLLPEYRERVKCVYIDPPYNTGKEGWVYNDNVNDPRMRKWLGQVVGKEAEDLCRHDKWLCMIYPRLALLREFLRDDGVIFMSIGKDEFASLRMVCDEIFGRRNFIESFVWQTQGHTENQERITSVHEYILAYEKRPGAFAFRDIVDPNVPEESKIRRRFAENSITKNGPVNPPSIVELPPGFPCAAETFDAPAYPRFEEFVRAVQEVGHITRSLTREFGAVYPLRIDSLTVRDGRLARRCRVFSGWSSLHKLRAFIDNGCRPIDDNGTLLRYYLSDRGVIYYRRENRRSRYIQTVLARMGTTERNRNELESIGVTFSYPKPKELISYLVEIATQDDDIVMDSFAGSGTTAHAVLLQNRKDGHSRRFILVEMLSEVAENVIVPRLRHELARSVDAGFRYCRLGRIVGDR